MVFDRIGRIVFPVWVLGLTMTLSGWAQEYRFAIEDVSVPAMVDSIPEFDVFVSIEQLDLPLAPTSGFSLGVASDPLALEIVEADHFGVLSTVNNGFGPSFFAVNILATGEGWNCGMIYSAAGNTLSFPVAEPVMRARYRSASPVSVESTTPLSFSSSLGSPAVPLNVTSPFNEDFAPVLSNGSVTFILQQSFVRGDCNADGMTALTDALALLDFLFAGGAAPGCGSACDFSGDEKISLGDVTYIALYLFLGGSTPPAPFPECGIIAAGLGCEVFAACP